jgi:polyhydroxyalkanoate synthase
VYKRQGGHNAGIVSEPGRRNRIYRVATSHRDDSYIAPDDWKHNLPAREGSWWPEWVGWLNARSTGSAPPPPMGDALCDAPGQYVFE